MTHRCHTSTMSTPKVYFAKSNLGDQFGEILEKVDNGIHTSFMEKHCHAPVLSNSGSEVVFSGHHSMTRSLKHFLGSFTDNSGTIKSLLPFQVEVVSNIVYRPPNIHASKTVKKYRLDSTGSISPQTYNSSGVISLKDDQDDIGMTVINDLFAGSGKTLTSILGAMIFSRDRGHDVINRLPLLMREQVECGWNTRMKRESGRVISGIGNTCNPVCEDIQYSNVVIIMCPKHLINQWVDSCRQAMNILDMVVDIHVNSTQTFPSGSPLCVMIYDNTSILSRSGLRFVPSIIVDEFISKNPSNLTMRSVDEMPIHGRLVLVSADAGRIKRTMFGAGKRSFLRRMVRYEIGEGGFDVEETMKYGIPLMSTSVLSTIGREGARSAMVMEMTKTPFEEYVVRYTPSLSSRLFGFSMEMSARSGKQILKERFGIDTENTKSIGDIKRIVDEKLVEIEKSNFRWGPLSSLQKKLQDFCVDKGSCSICMESFDNISTTSFINPCWHIFCDGCMKDFLNNSGKSCPICRTKIEGHTDATNCVDTTPGKTPGYMKKEDEGIRCSNTLKENLDITVDPCMGLDSSCINVLRCIKSDVDNKGGCDSYYRIIMVVPDDHFFHRFSDRVSEGFSEGVIDIIRLHTIGNKRVRVTHGYIDRNIQRFSSDRGSKIKILFTSECRTDSITGLDFPNIDCVLSVGFGNNTRGMSRLARISRFINCSKDSGNKMVRSISLIPNDMNQ